MSATPPALPAPDRFAANVNALVPVIAQIVTRARQNGIQMVDPSIFNVARGLLAALETTNMIRQFIQRSHPYWEQIRTRQNSFFIQHAGLIFDGIQVNIINSFRDLYLSKNPDGTAVLTPEEEDCLWTYFGSMVKISIKYVWETRLKEPNYAPELNIENIAAVWKLKLTR